VVSYRELYMKTRKQLMELESNSIDLRGKPTLVFEKDKWSVSMDDKHIILSKHSLKVV